MLRWLAELLRLCSCVVQRCAQNRSGGRRALKSKNIRQQYIQFNIDIINISTILLEGLVRSCGDVGALHAAAVVVLVAAVPGGRARRGPSCLRGVHECDATAGTKSGG